VTLPNPDELAQRVALSMYSDDRASQHLGMELIECKAGYARMTMKVQPEFTNGHGICHGGYQFMLADSTFAFACNSYNHRAVAAACNIDFLRAVQVGETLQAEAKVVNQGKRSGVYDVRVTNEAGALVALMRGKSALIAGTVLADPIFRKDKNDHE
jgi:acyl-CoA thioesterase